MIKKIEELSMNAFPALSTVLVNGWILRFSNGYSKRANSVNPVYNCSIDISENIKICEEMYKSRQLDTVFKLTESEASFKIDEILNQHGYSYEARTNVMLRNIQAYQITEEEKEGIVIYNELQDDWFEAFTSMNGVSEKNAVTLKRMLQKLTAEACYACIVNNGQIEAVGLGVAERGYIGMYDICVHENQRRKGLGTRIMKNLIHRGLEMGCTYSYLQVVDANEGAKILYDRLGYEQQYSYWYRVKK
ncbi:MAG: N-acetylglutamate synthase [Clostridiales bacterium]|nr:N-acetylglutamate synthase [Clostridiales bacterium]